MDDSYTDDPQLYSTVYADVVADIEPLVALMKGAGGRVLELCCGNGRILLPALAAGVGADGLDRSLPMLADLRDAMAVRGLEAGVHAGDMRSFDLPERYALIVIAFNSFLHNLTQNDQLATLRRCRAHLAPGGRLAIVTFHPAAAKLEEWAAGEKLVKDIPNRPGPGRVRVFDTTVDDRIEQVRSVARRIEFIDDAGSPTRTEHWTFRIRYVFKPEMELLLLTAGFGHWTIRPMESGPDGRGAFVDRAAREGDTLLWTAWNG